MAHTIFCGDNFQTVYDEMRRELQEFIDKDTSENKELEFYKHFTQTCKRFARTYLADAVHLYPSLSARSSLKYRAVIHDR